MEIQDAIKQAGEGGMIRRTEWPEEFEIGMKSNFQWAYEGEETPLEPKDILADDWEVVTPVIEIGDLVKCSSELANKNHSYEVVGIGVDYFSIRPKYHIDAIKTNCTLLSKKVSQ